jgi:hypothetical protein
MLVPDTAQKLNQRPSRVCIFGSLPNLPEEGDSATTVTFHPC